MSLVNQCLERGSPVEEGLQDREGEYQNKQPGLYLAS